MCDPYVCYANLIVEVICGQIPVLELKVPLMVVIIAVGVGREVRSADRHTIQVILQTPVREIVAYELVLKFLRQIPDVITGGVGKRTAETHDLLDLLSPVDRHIQSLFGVCLRFVSEFEFRFLQPIATFTRLEDSDHTFGGDLQCIQIITMC